MQGYDLSNLRILVVDDNEFMISLISAMMKAFGVGHCDIAPNADSAMEKLSDTGADIVFIDWRMPGMSGIDLVGQIRKGRDSPNRYLPIVMLTGMNERKHVIAARDAGVNDFLAKPVAARDLYQRLVNLIEKPRPFVKEGDYFGPSWGGKPRSAPAEPQKKEGPDDGWYLD
jgi:CheY-like chemotaxis protein